MMNKAARQSTARRVGALAAVFFFFLAASSGALRHILRLYAHGAQREAQVVSEQFTLCVRQLPAALRVYFETSGQTHPDCPAELLPEKSNFRFTARDAQNHVILSTDDKEPYRYGEEKVISLEVSSAEEKRLLRTEKVTVNCYLCDDIRVDDAFSRALRLLQIADTWEDALWALSVVFFALTVLYMVLTIRIALREARRPLSNMRLFGTIPPDLYLCCVLPAFVFFSKMLSGGLQEWDILRGYIRSGGGVYRFFLRPACMTGLFALGFFLMLIVAYSLRRGGVRCLFTLRRFEQIPFSRRSILYLVLIQAVKLSAIALYLSAYTRMVVLFLILEKAVTLPLVYRMLRELRVLMDKTAQFVQGDLSGSAERPGDFVTLAQHGADVDAIARRISTSADEYIQSSNFRAELITNLSHDIKTPLTSIISYAQLLQQPGLSAQERAKYLQVLQRHSGRLQKLVEDLTEVSDAASGNVKVKLQSVDLCALIRQSAMGFEERLQKNGITLRFSIPPTPVWVRADSRLLWRVADNLMNNICKYARRDSEVQIAVLQENGAAAAVYRNESAYAVTLSGEELMERFVRADSARSTDGSGLGLSIAHSLMQLQGGELRLKTEWDTFTAQIVLQKR